MSYVALKEVSLTSGKKNNLDDVIGVILSFGLERDICDSKLCYTLGHGVLETLTTKRKFKRRRARASLMEMTDVAATFGSRPCEELKVRISQTVLLLLRLFKASQLGRSVALHFFFKSSGSFPDRTYPTVMS